MEIRVDVRDGPIEAAERAGELVAGHVRSLLALMEGSDAARVTAMAAVLEATDRVVSVLEGAPSPGRLGRAHVLALVEILVRFLDRLAPAAARGLIDDDPHVRKAAEHATRAFTRLPAIAASARSAAQRHPDPTVRGALATR